MYKFRPMVVNADRKLNELVQKNEMSGLIFKIKNDLLVTNVGKFIRKTSFDELQQLVNVLDDGMSFVTPRTSLQNEIPQFEPWMLEKLKVKPGFTC